MDEIGAMDRETLEGYAMTLIVSVKRLQSRVAELEREARLGKAVLAMEKNRVLKREWDGQWWSGRNVAGAFGKTGRSPEQALGIEEG